MAIAQIVAPDFRLAFDKAVKQNSITGFRRYIREYEHNQKARFYVNQAKKKQKEIEGGSKPTSTASRESKGTSSKPTSTLLNPNPLQLLQERNLDLLGDQEALFTKIWCVHYKGVQQLNKTFCNILGGKIFASKSLAEAEHKRLKQRKKQEKLSESKPKQKSIKGESTYALWPCDKMRANQLIIRHCQSMSNENFGYMTSKGYVWYSSTRAQRYRSAGKLIENGMYTWATKGEGNECYMIVNVKGMLEGNSYSLTVQCQINNAYRQCIQDFLKSKTNYSWLNKKWTKCFNIMSDQKNINKRGFYIR